MLFRHENYCLHAATRARHGSLFRCVELVGIEFDLATAMLTAASNIAWRWQVGLFIHISPSRSRNIQTPIAPIVHPKLNSVKEFPSGSPCGTRQVAMRNSECGIGSATGPVAVFGGAPKTRFTKLNGPTNGSCAPPEPAREPRALPKTLRVRRPVPNFRQVLDCGGPPPLFPGSTM